MQRNNLKKVTLVLVSSIKIDACIQALSKSCEQIDFYETILISHKKPKNLPEKIIFKKGPYIDNIKKYNQFILFDLAKYIKSDFALIIQYDGYIINPDMWSDVFLSHDYIGSPWNKYSYFLENGRNIRVGNGGFSLRSKRLLSFFNENNILRKEDETIKINEDFIISFIYREFLEKSGIKFAPIEIASRFSKEQELSDSEKRTFGFHKYKRNTSVTIKNMIKKILTVLRIRLIRKPEYKSDLEINFNKES